MKPRSDPVDPESDLPNARSYTIEASQEPAAADSWTHVGIATSASDNEEHSGNDLKVRSEECPLWEPEEAELALK